MKAGRILLAEDDRTMAALLAELLTALGYEVCAIEATEADLVNAAARLHPDLLIVDVRLGSGSGTRAIDTIQRAGPVPHIFVSGDISAILSHRPNAVAIQKPFGLPVLAQAIQHLLCP